MIFYIFLLFHPILAESSNTTDADFDTFYFHTRITCRFISKSRYNYTIRFYEHDTILAGRDDPITPMYRHQTIRGGTATNLIYSGKMNGDGELGDSYEVYAYVKHDCILEGKPDYVYIKLRNNHCKIGKGDCHVYFSIDLTGLVGTEYREPRIVQK